jgi:FemAB family protein
MTGVIQKIVEMAGGLSGEKVLLVTGSPEVWKATLAACDYVPVAYTYESMAYQLSYRRSCGADCCDGSLIWHWNGLPCGVWPLSFTVAGEEISLHSHGSPILPPLFIEGTPLSVCKRLCRASLDLVDRISQKSGSRVLNASTPFLDRAGMGEWHDEWMRRGATCQVTHQLFLDLRPELAEIKAGFRKSYKSLLNSGRREWTVSVLDTPDPVIWGEFAQLHLDVSGRKTRSDETWALQLRQIEVGEALLVVLRNAEGKMVGGGFFQFSRDEALYAVAAYDRALFQKPLGHVVQVTAIEEFRYRNIRWLKLGRRFYPGENPAPTEKELSISDFKSGFSSHLLPEFSLTRKLPHE